MLSFLKGFNKKETSESKEKEINKKNENKGKDFLAVPSGIARDFYNNANNFYNEFLNEIKKYLKEKYNKKEEEIANLFNLAFKKLKEDKDKHIIITFDKLNILSYSESLELIKKLLKKHNVKHIFVGSILDIDVKEKDGKKIVYYQGEEVKPVLFPNLKAPYKQIVLPPYEYISLIEKNEWETVEGLKKFVNIVKDAVALNASDIHIVPNFTSGGIVYYTYFRINKELKEIKKYIMNAELGQNLIRAVQLRANEETKGNFRAGVFNKAQEARIEFKDLKVDLRLEFIPDGMTLEHMVLCARIIKKQELKRDEDLEKKLLKWNYDKKTINIWKNAIKTRGKIIVISGITNSGKSTLMMNLISSMEETKRIMTVEDPVEAIVTNPNVSQHQVYLPKQEELKMGFVEYAKAFKRADPDVVVIGEWREDPELTNAIKSMAYAGQLVFTTTHIASAYQIYEALRDVYKVDEKTTASFLLLSFNQALIPRLCEHCKKKKIIEKVEDIYSLETIKVLPFSSFEKELLVKILKDKLYEKGELVIYERNKKGCEHCNYTGVSGLLPVYEYFINSQEIKDAVLKEKMSPDELKKFAFENELGTLKIVRFLELFLRGLVDKEEIFRI